MYRKILSWLLTFIMVFSMFGGIGLEGFGISDPECKIGETEYLLFADALTNSVDGDIITLLKNVNYVGKIYITGKKITFDLNGFNLSASNIGDTTVEVDLGGDIDLTGQGEFNVMGSSLASGSIYDRRDVISIKNGGKIKVTNVIASGNSGVAIYGVYISEGKATVLNNVDVSGNLMMGVYTTGSNSFAEIHNNVKSLNSIAVLLHDNSNVTVHGNIESYYRGIDADNSTAVVKGDVTSTANSGDSARAASGGKIYIGGDSISHGNNSFGVKSIHENSFVSVSGSAITYGMYGYGSFASSGGSAVIQGDSISYSEDGNGVGATYEASVVVKGDVLSENGTGARAWHNGSDKPTITVDGEIIAETFIEFGSSPTIYNIDDYLTPTTKEGFFTYTDGYSTVWMSYPAVWGIEIESSDIYPFDGGDGSSEETAYEISTANQLAQFAYNVNNGNNYSGKYFKLTSDINLSGKEWVPIGKDYNHRFMGNFNGDNFKMEGLTITDISFSDNYGLFGYLGENGVISNLIIESGKIELTEAPTNNSGLGGVAGYSNGLISNCTNKIDIIAAHNSEIYTGGIVGLGNCNTSLPYEWSSRIENCHNEGAITLGDRGAAGGIIGVQLNSNSYTFVRNSSNEGNITGGRAVKVGGIAGWLSGGHFRNSTVINCYNTGNLTTGSLSLDTYVEGNIGGIVGYLYGGVVENSYNTGNIEVLYRDTTNTSGFYVGGLVGYGNSPVVKNSYNTGILNGPEDRVGPMSGANNNYSDHENCYYKEGTVPDELMNTGALKLTENQMKGIDNSTITFVDSLDKEITYGPANGALIYALNNGKSEEAYGWYYDDRYNEGYPFLSYNNEKPYVVSFDSQGGTTASTVTITAGDSINTSPDTTKDTYTLNGWFTSSEGGEKIEFPYIPDQNILLYAQWTSNDSPEEPSPSPRPSVPSLGIETTTLKDGMEGKEYKVELKAEGGISPYSWSAEGLPADLSISEEGIISGTLEESGNFSIKVELMDNRNYYKSKIFDLLIEGIKDDEDIEDTNSEEDSFIDVKDHWSKDYIKEVVSKNIINGYPDGTFRPENKITREEFASILVRALGLKPETGTSFEDTLNRWSTDSISTAVYYNIITGYNQSTFGPGDPITREQMAVMIARALKLDGQDEETTLSDIDKASSWAKASIIIALKEGLIDGYPDGTFRAKNNLTRAEAIKVIFNLLNNLENSN